MPSTGSDKYSNIVQETVVTSAINTISFTEINIGLNLFDKVGLLISRVQWDPSNNFMTDMNAEGDRMRLALVQSNSIASLSLFERAVIDMIELDTILHAAGVSSFIHRQPLEQDYSNLPGGGILVSPRPLFLGINTDGFANVQSAVCRLYFTIIKLKAEEYFELLESRRFFG